MRYGLSLLALFLFACIKDPETCAPVSLAGEWHAHYDLQGTASDSCGPLPDATVTLNAQGFVATPECTSPADLPQGTSCFRDFKYTCSASTASASYQGTLHVVEIDRLEVDLVYTATASVSNQTCHAPYKVTYTR